METTTTKYFTHILTNCGRVLEYNQEITEAQAHRLFTRLFLLETIKTPNDVHYRTLDQHMYPDFLGFM